MGIPTSSISNFKKFSLKILRPYTACAVVFGLAFQYFFEKKIILNSQINGSYKVNRIINSENTNEIPIFGSSRAEGSFVPSVLGSNYFNYGISGTQDNVMLFFLKEECKKNKTTPILLNFDIDGLNYELGDIANYIYNANYAPVKQLIGDKDEAIFRVPFVKYYGYYEYYLKMYLNNKINLTKKTDNGASLELNKLTKSKFNELVNQRLATAATFKNNPHLESDFFNLIKSHSKRTFIIVISPYHKSYFNQFKNYPDVTNFMTKIKTFANAKVFDFSQVNYPDSLFINTTHLNYAGAKQFSEELKDSIMKLKN
ncbi:MAG: hypothetical protein IT237_06590 [Bacteroidia bacterium]|nr:hypothetical protein [Bacteroidia bacterium]